MTDTERLPEPLITNYGWQADAAGRGMGPKPFDPAKARNSNDGVRKIANPSI